MWAAPKFRAHPNLRLDYHMTLYLLEYRGIYSGLAVL